MKKFKFSNFQMTPLTIEGTIWPSVEHYFQAMKSLDKEEQQKIKNLSTPGKAKRAGRKVKMRVDWPSVKEQFMMTALRAKLTHKSFKESLIATGFEEIVEWNKWHDNEWGACICPQCKGNFGKNKLGKLLMKLREELKQ